MLALQSRKTRRASRNKSAESGISGGRQCGLYFRPVPSAFAVWIPAPAQELFISRFRVMNRLAVSAAARLDFWHSGSVSLGSDAELLIDVGSSVHNDRDIPAVVEKLHDCFALSRQFCPT